MQFERARIYEREKDLLLELVDIRRRRNAARRQSSREERGACERANTAGVSAKAHAEDKKRDRFGKELNVGDTVEFLTPGRLVGKIWTVYRITDKRVLCERHNGVHKTHREFKNVRKLD